MVEEGSQTPETDSYYVDMVNQNNNDSGRNNGDNIIFNNNNNDDDSNRTFVITLRAIDS